jgi:predicted MFS family arabinose efflux permease
MNHKNIIKKLTFRTTVITILLMVIGGAAVTTLSVGYTQKILYPQLSAKEVILSNILCELINKAVTIGYPSDKLTGLSSYFSELRSENSEITYIALAKRDGTILNIDGNSCSDLSNEIPHVPLTDTAYHFTTSDCFHSVYPVVSGERSDLLILIGIKKSIFWESVKTSLFDSLTLLLVSLLIVIELTLFVFNRTLISPLTIIHTFTENVKNGIFTNTLKSSDKNMVWKFADSLNELIERVNINFHKLRPEYRSLYKEYKFASSDDVPPMYVRNAVEGRLPLFLIVFADSLSLSFLPLFVSTLQIHIDWLSDKFLAGLPITIFMLFWAISLPYAGSWSDRKGRDFPFLIGAVITAIGLIGTGLAHSYYGLLVWRAVTAVGYGIVFITSQGFILDSTPKEKRTQGMAMFLSAFFAGSLCGSAIGGIFAERFGYRFTYLFSSLVAIGAILCVLTRLSVKHVTETQGTKKMTFKDIRYILKDSHFLSVMLFSAIPAKICLVGFIYYTIPILLKSIGTNQGTIGRIIMAYGLQMVIFSPLIAKLADKFKSRVGFIVTGGYIAAFSLIMIQWTNGVYGVLVASILMGMAHSISVSSQMVYVTDMFSKKESPVGLGTVIALFRLIERGGNIMGPIVAGLLISLFGFTKGIVALGVLTFSGTFLFWLSTFIGSHSAKKVELNYES